MKILICGLPGTGKTTLAKALVDRLGAVHFNADEVRSICNDTNFSDVARIDQARRMGKLADIVVRAGYIAVCDFICPFQICHDMFAADFTIWMRHDPVRGYADTTKMFEHPKNFDISFKTWDDPYTLCNRIWHDDKFSALYEQNRKNYRARFRSLESCID